MISRSILIFFLASALSSSIGSAGERLRVVVNDLDANGVPEQVSRVVSDHLRVKLIETRRFIIPEREKMETILAEQAVGLELGQCFSQECAIEIGRLMQANKMLVGTVSLLNATYSINLRFLDLETGVAEFSVEEKCQSSDDLYLAAEQVAARIVAFIPQRGVVTAVSGDDIIVDMGRVDGVIVGMKFRILREVERVPGYPEEELITMAEVTSVQESWSRVQPDRQRDPASIMQRVTVQQGDIAVAPQTVTVDELPQYGFLTVYSRPVGAEVYVDELFRGRTTESGLEARVSVGRHKVRVSAPAHETDEREIELRSGQRSQYNATLEPILPRTRYKLGITAFSYLRQTPDDSHFRSQLDKRVLQGIQFAVGNVSVPIITEVGGSWTHANMKTGKGYGINEVHRINGFGHIGLAFRWNMFVPYASVGYEFGQLMFNEGNFTDEGSDLGGAGKLDQNGWYWTAGVFINRWIRVGYSRTWGQPETDMGMLTVGLNLAGS
jgi:hypothetical protein